MSIEIKNGDLVSVHYHGAQMTLTPKAKVIHMLCNPGDSWVFEDIDTKTVYYVSEGCTITKLK